MTNISARELHAWVGFLRAQHRVLEQLEDDLRIEHDVSLSEYEVLLHLDRAPEHRLRMSDLAANVLLTPSGLTRLADRMITRGLIARAACESDRRVSYIVLTADGKACFDRARPTHVRGVRQHFLRHLGSERDTVARALHRIASPPDS